VINDDADNNEDDNTNVMLLLNRRVRSRVRVYGYNSQRFC